jgi:uncharacterized protein
VQGHRAAGAGRGLLTLVDAGWFYAAAIPAVILVGLAKGGFAGVGTLATPIVALVVPPVEAAAILLPILILQDAVGVWALRREWNRRVLVSMLPPAAVGIGLGYLYTAYVSAAAVALVVGAVSILFGGRQLVLMQGGTLHRRPPSALLATIAGTSSGFVSQLSHAGAPPFQMYVLPLGLPRNEFVGTSAIFFAVVNWMKVPAFLALHQFTPQSVRASLMLMPLAFASTYAGVWLVKRVPVQRFYRIIYWLMIAVGARLLWSGMSGLHA